MLQLNECMTLPFRIRCLCIRRIGRQILPVIYLLPFKYHRIHMAFCSHIDDRPTTYVCMKRSVMIKEWNGFCWRGGRRAKAMLIDLTCNKCQRNLTKVSNMLRSRMSYRPMTGQWQWNFLSMLNDTRSVLYTYSKSSSSHQTVISIPLFDRQKINYISTALPMSVMATNETEKRCFSIHPKL